jgi:hypothetical protein
MKLTDQQILEAKRKQDGLMQDIGNMKYVQERFKQGEDYIHQLVANGVITPEDYQATQKEFTDKLNSGEMPDYLNIVNNHVGPKLAKVSANFENTLSTASLRGQGGYDSKTGKYSPFDATKWNQWYDNMQTLNPNVYTEDKRAARGLKAENEYRQKAPPASSQYAPGTSRNPNELSQTTLPNGKRGWDLSTTGHKWDGGTLSDGTVVKNVPIQNVWVDDDGKYKMSVLVTPPKDPLGEQPAPIIKITDVPGDLKATLNKKGYKLENFQQKDKTGTPAKTTEVDKTKNPNYRGTDTVKAKDKKTGAIIDFVWDDSVGNYVKK